MSTLDPLYDKVHRECVRGGGVDYINGFHRMELPQMNRCIPPPLFEGQILHWNQRRPSEPWNMHVYRVDTLVAVWVTTESYAPCGKTPEYRDTKLEWLTLERGGVPVKLTDAILEPSLK